MLKKVKANSAYYKEVSSYYLTNSPMPSKGMLASQGEEVIAGLFGASDETIVANDRLYVVPRPTMLLIDLKIKIADIADHNKKKITNPDVVQFWFIFYYFPHVKPDLMTRKQNGGRKRR